MQSLEKTNSPIDDIIERWLDSVKRSKSGSSQTQKNYRDTLASFRSTLRRGGIDLDNEDTVLIADVAAIWADQRSPRSRRSGEVANATYDVRLNIISSFYTFVQHEAKRRHAEPPRNPMQDIERRHLDAYAGAEALESEDIARRLARIDRSTIKGKRDYALLCVGLQTCRRAIELVTLQIKHLRIRGNQVTMHFDHCKGGKKAKDSLDAATAKVFLEYLKEIYGVRPSDADPEAPVWVSFAPVNKGQAIGYHTLAKICDTYLGTTKTHTLRHTGAATSHKEGSDVMTIKERLGHSSIAITDRYLKSMSSVENPVAEKTAEKFGIGKAKKKS